MSETMLLEPVELTDAELDLVTGAANAVAGVGLANVALALDSVTINALNNLNIHDVLSGNSLRDIASHNNIGVGAVIQALGGVAGVLQHVG